MEASGASHVVAPGTSWRTRLAHPTVPGDYFRDDGLATYSEDDDCLVTNLEDDQPASGRGAGRAPMATPVHPVAVLAYHLPE